MNFKTLSPENHPTVILFRSSTKKGKPTVTILSYAYFPDVDEEDAEISERIHFQSISSAKQYIEDFTEAKAANWCAFHNAKVEKPKYEFASHGAIISR